MIGHKAPGSRKPKEAGITAAIEPIYCATMIQMAAPMHQLTHTPSNFNFIHVHLYHTDSYCNDMYLFSRKWLAICLCPPRTLPP